jgi:hypothetical protein
VAKRRNIASEATEILRRQRRLGERDFERAWYLTWRKLFGRSLPHTTSSEWRRELANWKIALRFARPAFEAAYLGETCPMVPHFTHLPIIVHNDRFGLLGVDDEPRESGSPRIHELVVA